MPTEFKHLGGLVIKINQLSDAQNHEAELAIRSIGGYFYSTRDNQVHLTDGGIHHYYFDEEGHGHHYEQVHKVLATSNKSRYPELPLLTAEDLVQG